MKIVFFGTSEFAIPSLRALCEAGHEIMAVVTVPDQPIGRKKILTAPPLKVAALKLNIPIYQPNSFKDNQFFEQFKLLAPDLSVVAAYGKIISQRYLEIPRHGFLNIHPSLLPKYRGPSPIQTAILNGDKETGISIINVDTEMDHGFILTQITLAIGPHENYKELHDRLANEGAQLIVTTIENMNVITQQKQNHDQATFTKLLTREDGRINWDQPCEKIYNQIRALNPEPGTWTNWKDKTLNILKAEILNKELGTPGLIEKIDGNIVVGTKKCYLILKSIQLEGGKEMDARSFANGHPDFLNSKLEPA